MRATRRSIGTLAAVIALSGALWGALIATAAAQERPAAFLDSLVGDWRGSGFIVRRASGAQETTLCRLTTRRTDSGIRNQGRCAANSAGGDVEGGLDYDPSRRVFVGSFLDPEARKMRPAEGTLDGGVLTLGHDEVRGGDRVHVVATVHLQGADRYRVNVTETAAGAETTVLRMTFTRR